ncbi:angiopoietin-related protein 7-like [Drosophila innubila]|uniref:angiopoietin-related protein 7-like n=1 Tax=Drosophila innubila TaxID=198719 RepID=UPI00148E2986|nr:angiopoietin-related protein 7-like [Drosophila innubila]
MKICVSVFIIVAGVFAVISADSLSFCQDSKRTESDCASYCYAAVKPLLQMAPLCHSKDQEISELKDKLAELQIKVAVYEERNSQCKISEEALRNQIESAESTQPKRHFTPVLNNPENENAPSNNTHEIKVKVPKSRIIEKHPDVEYEYPSNCLDVELGVVIRRVKVDGIGPFRAVCYDAGWMMIQRRRDQRTSFQQNWAGYRAGFGDLQSSFFIGLEKLYRLTNSQPHELYIELEAYDGRSTQAHYDNFRVGSEEEGYKLIELGEYLGEAGDAGDGLRLNVNAKFSTYDRDNDNIANGNCVKIYESGWWHNNCTESNLNGVYFNEFNSWDRRSIWWGPWMDRYSLKSVAMYIRPK